MKKISKTLAIVLALVMMFALFTACGNGGGTATPAPATDNGGSTATDPGTGDNGGEPSTPDKVYTFKIDYPNAENSATYPVLVQWADYLREESGGALDFQIYSGGALGALPECVNNCIAGVTDGFWSGVTIYAGVFPTTEVFCLPFLGAKEYDVITKSVQEYVATNEQGAAEWSNLYTVCLYSNLASPLMFAAGKEVATAADFQGLNLRPSNAYTTEWLNQLGANPVSCGINDGYEYIEKNIIQGGYFFFDQLQSSKLYEVIDHMMITETIFPLNMLCLNKEKYEALPDDLKAIVDGSGEWFYTQSAPAFDAQVESLLKACDDHGVVYYEPTEELITAMTEASKPAWQLWIDNMNKAGYDGQGTFDYAMELIEKHNAQA